MASRSLAVVTGSGELGSAIAVRLHEAGLGVVLCDHVDPPGIRRGMSFVDAWYLGIATHAGVRATFCSNLRSIPTVLADHRSVAATTWSWRGVANYLAPSLVIDVHPAATTPPLDVTDIAEREASAGPGPYAVARWRYRQVRAPEDLVGERTSRLGILGYPRISLAHAPCDGRFHTVKGIGDCVLQGEEVATLGKYAIRSPANGALVGLAMPGSRVRRHARVIEVVVDGDASSCYGISSACDALARDVVCHALRDLGDKPPTVRSPDGADSVRADDSCARTTRG